jgi:pimeloyl-ACP methyl ester carboxylesterase
MQDVALPTVLLLTARTMDHRQIVVDGLDIHVAEAGAAERPPILFLHGWPESWMAFARIMESLSREWRVVAIDLPGIGQSASPAPSNDKRTLAKYVRGVILALNLRNVTLVGHDIGGQIVYAYLHAYANDVRQAVIMSVAVPGVEPWPQVVRNPLIWHFAFHAIPDLPERLVQGHQADYFAYFYDAISARPRAVDARAREAYAAAYSRPEALRTGFEWYRAFKRDEQDNRRVQHETVRTPVLYLRGAAEQGLELERYVEGLRAGGLTAVEGQTIPDSGHFGPDEQPEAVVGLLRAFLTLGQPNGR